MQSVNSSHILHYCRVVFSLLPVFNLFYIDDVGGGDHDVSNINISKSKRKHDMSMRQGFECTMFVNVEWDTCNLKKYVFLQRLAQLYYIAKSIKIHNNIIISV